MSVVNLPWKIFIFLTENVSNYHVMFFVDENIIPYFSRECSMQIPRDMLYAVLYYYNIFYKSFRKICFANKEKKDPHSKIQRG